ncbi:hypothetical protein KPB01_14640, partial [Burkholderia sola]|nr:hypothetical protein [Burkholderia sola]
MQQRAKTAIRGDVHGAPAIQFRAIGALRFDRYAAQPARRGEIGQFQHQCRPFRRMRRVIVARRRT